MPKEAEAKAKAAKVVEAKSTPATRSAAAASHNHYLPRTTLSGTAQPRNKIPNTKERAPTAPPKTPKPDAPDTGQNVHTWLERLGLSQYAASAVDAGFDDMLEVIAAIDKTGFDALVKVTNMLPGHTAKLRAAIIRKRPAEAPPFDASPGSSSTTGDG
ncbi:hypothetical protein T492DRAFT_874379 [Pavlovales sp. CCMP2436]|nr:hypothetical protein T492DRAFT_874379 [Pavlovales sp. CCMP2436]